ncbi:MAG: glycosyltransferase family 1 protein [Proteobacteria bacterium]|nr:glycosyltransferase family 1 protein [Pseudomonadota bacterium]
MKIAIDARMIRPGSMHGIARYVYELLRGISGRNVEHSFFVLVNSGTPLVSEDWCSKFTFIYSESSWISFREQLELPRLLRQYQIDLFHSPSFVAPLMVPCKMVMTIHDLNHLVLPQFYTPFHQLYYNLFVRRCIQRSHSILTVSHFSRREIERNLVLDPNKIFVTYNGVSDFYKRVTDKEHLDYVREIYELPEDFILCVSSNKPHKNVQMLVKAYCYSDINIPLVLASPVDASLLRMAEAFNKKHLIYFSKFIAEQHLPAIYSMTRLFVYPSTYEGFGLPPLEAMSCGAPVVVARSSSLPEVVGDHAIFANPYDYKDVARALEVGVYDSAFVESLMRGVDQHRQKFSWERMVTQTIAVYDRCFEPSEAPLLSNRVEANP